MRRRESVVVLAHVSRRERRERAPYRRMTSAGASLLGDVVRSRPRPEREPRRHQARDARRQRPREPRGKRRRQEQLREERRAERSLAAREGTTPARSPRRTRRGTRTPAAVSSPGSGEEARTRKDRRRFGCPPKTRARKARARAAPANTAKSTTRGAGARVGGQRETKNDQNEQRADARSRRSVLRSRASSHCVSTSASAKVSRPIFCVFQGVCWSSGRATVSPKIRARSARSARTPTRIRVGAPRLDARRRTSARTVDGPRSVRAPRHASAALVRAVAAGEGASPERRGVAPEEGIARVQTRGAAGALFALARGVDPRASVSPASPPAPPRPAIPGSA